MAILGQMNLSDAKELTGGNYLLPGQYTVKVTNVEATKTKNDKQQLKITFENLEMKAITHYANMDSTNEIARDWMYTFLNYLGNDMTNFNGNITTEMILNKMINIKVEREYNDYNGKYYSKVKRIERWEKGNVLNDIDEQAVEAMKSEVQQPARATMTNDFAADVAYDKAMDALGMEISDDDLPF